MLTYKIKYYNKSKILLLFNNKKNKNFAKQNSVSGHKQQNLSVTY